jgi:hypothetical protein
MNMVQRLKKVILQPLMWNHIMTAMMMMMAVAGEDASDSGGRPELTGSTGNIKDEKGRGVAHRPFML